MRRKSPKTLNLPDGLAELATAYAEATQRSFSSLVEDLLREELADKGAMPKVTMEEIMVKLEQRLAAKTARKAKAKKKK